MEVNYKTLRILHGRWVLTVMFATNDTDFNFDDGSESLLSQLQEEESRPYCNFDFYTVHSATYALLLNLEEFKIYIKVHINIAPTFFGLRPSSGSLY
jgi:hypothetical protein